MVLIGDEAEFSDRLGTDQGQHSQPRLIVGGSIMAFLWRFYIVIFLNVCDGQSLQGGLRNPQTLPSLNYSPA
jgi:hypothetical protein